MLEFLLSISIAAMLMIGQKMKYNSEIEHQKRMRRLEEMSREGYRREAVLRKQANDGLINENNRLRRYIDDKKLNNKTNVNSDTKEAIKKAMIYSHPDKGMCRNGDDFIKFKKLYDEMK